MPNDTLVVPVQVAAFAVNAQTRDTDGTYVMQRWIANFTPLVNDNAAPEPQPFSGTQPWGGDESRLGVYLHWQLPEALCRGHQDEVTGEIGDFPLVPNRWLVIRRSNQGVRSWIVHSDFLDRRDGAVSYLDPHADTPTATKIGRAVELTTATDWTEPGGTPFLTALGPGLLTFSVYQPYNTNVFSLHDRLDDIDGDDRLSYHVVGWYSDPDRDILVAGPHSHTPFEEVMRRLEWQLASTFGSPRRSLYSGRALGIDWRPDGGVYPSDSPIAREIAVAIGNNTAEAASELQAQAGGSNALGADEAELYRAFTLGVLNDYDRADGDLFPERAAHDSGFSPVPGGYRWRALDRSGDDARAALSPAERAAEQARAAEVVAELNREQRDLDALERELADARQRLFVLWALSREPKQPEVFSSRIARELDPGNAGGAAGKVTALTAQLAQRRAEVPWATDADQLAARARAYATDHGLRAGLELQRVPEQPFELAVDPVLMLQGANLNAPMTRGSDLPCRVEERLVTSIGSITSTTVAADVAKVNITGLPGPMPALVTEFFIIDHARKTGVSLGGADGTLPEYGTEPWRQPWQPLFLMWEAEYTAIPFVEGSAELWSFDRNYYRWQGEGGLEPAVTVSGRQVLMPTSGYDQEGKLDNYAAGRDDLPTPLLTRVRAQFRELDQLSQRLDGLSAAVGQRLSEVNAAPTGALGELIAAGVGLNPDPGPQPVFEWDDWEPSDFQELRAGHLLFTRLSVVDRFGRAVNLIDNPLHFDRLIKPESMTPEHFVGEIQTDRYVELGPRLLQPARLRFDFLSADTNNDVELTAGANPVCAWLIHNRLDRSIACYDPRGRALGDLRVVLTANGQRIVHWSALPDSPIQDFDQLAERHPHAHRFLGAVKRQGPTVFDAVRGLLDDTLAVIDPDGPEDQSLAFLLGRPLALVRARLDLELCGAIRTDVTWQEVLKKPPTQPQMPGYRWNVRLGEARQTDDGLVGYVLNDDYDHFDTVLEPGGGHDGYLRAIENGDRLKLAFTGESTATLTLLMDTRAAVHATTDILPVSAVFVPQQFTDAALAAMAVNFRTGPLLIATTEHGAATLPQPATATGSWTWTEPTGTDWTTLPITVPDPASLPIGSDPEIRSGYLVLDDAAQWSRNTRQHNERGAR
ncbi:hypothetical protein OH799_06625 [Nocardia sp. NBC_00881]|uniref:hypothetical protein n=1 Tax=Nocardia sp. NBC_00881 TaxID=2975995 RepID=UPI00386F1259|nr:hypothetical protein OH799_06625 [Nocardia sp. NBC_00881]